MPTEVVLDSSAVAALFFKDPYSEKVERAVKKYFAYHTVDLAYAEVGSVAWKRTQAFKEDQELTMKALERAATFIENVCQVTHSRDLLTAALELGVKHGVTFYDSLFLTLAKRLGTRLLTTDEQLHRRVMVMEELQNAIALP